MDAEQFFIGSLLGDASFVKKSPGHNTYVVFKHCESQLDYLKWKYDFIKSSGFTDDHHKGVVEVNIKSGDCFPNYQRQFKCSTISDSRLNEYKILSEAEILEKFGEGAFVIWLLDDGNVYNRRIKIACGSKSKSFCVAMVEKLNSELGLDSYYYEHPTNSMKNYIVIRSDSFDDVKRMVVAHIPVSVDVVRRKFEPSLEILVKYHGDVKPLEFINGNSDWIDLRVAEDVEMKAGEFKIISLGVSMKLPEGYEAVVIPRSSTFKTWGILQTNHFGLIDNSYCGDNDIWRFPALATRDVMIPKNSRICQFRIQKKMEDVDFTTVDHLGFEDRGGIGSSGVA